MEICVEGRHKADIRQLYQKANKLRYEIDSKIDSIDIGSDQKTAEKFITNSKTLLESYSNTIRDLSSEARSQPIEEQDDWNSKIKKLIQHESLMKSRLQKILNLRAQAQRKNGYKYEDVKEQNGLKGLVEVKEGLEQSRKIALEIQSYGAAVWNSIKQQSGRLQGVFIKTDKMNDGLDVSHNMANTLFRKTKTDCYIFVGLALLTVSLIFICLYYVKPMIFS